MSENDSASLVLGRQANNESSEHARSFLGILVRFKERSFLVEQKLVQLCSDILTATLQCQLPINNAYHCVNAGFPGWVANGELRRVQLEAIANIGVNNSRTTFSKGALTTYADESLGVSFPERQAYIPDSLNGEARIWSCGDFARVGKRTGV
jgi:hypothetical protein